MLRESVIGISPPEEEKHQFFIDVQPLMGTTLKARARVQINLAVSQVRDIKQVATFPDIVFPIMWFEDVSTASNNFGKVQSIFQQWRFIIFTCE